MLVKKEVIVNGKKAVLSYDNLMFGKNANVLNYESYGETHLKFIDLNITVALLINGEEHYSDSELKNIPDFYFEVVDFYNNVSELACSDAIYETINNEEELLRLMTKSSYFLNNSDEFKKCPKGFIAGYCDDEVSNKCEYSALTLDGLCGAECLRCEGDIYAYDKEGYSCSCSTLSFEE